MSVSLTDRAINQLKTQLDKRGKGLGMRLGVKKSGCSGFAYVIDFADQISPEDQVFDNNGVKVIINQSDLEFLNGIELDYTREGISEAFRFNNPNVKAMCGCGESFTVG
ncbi:MAG: iron-sulfur cluster assembly accessory protein [Gammaproteobacteria bacterium]|nr:iron-sulfur cluster assembly accessory protein [Gammaproteobacteria bacterium]